MAENYPVSVFHFTVEWGGTRIGFTEVSGLTVELQSIDYREGNAKEYQVTKMPGIPQYSNITLKRGIYRGDNEFFQWLNTVQMNNIERRDLTISLLNEEHEPVTVWKVKEAWPCKVEGPSLNSTGNEVAVETIELCHEGLTIEFT
ncbi:phage tail protein [Aliifodinibius sp. S!AR15-10]|uniref:phage tail protein n=1 Tax=Aliifodinibius sp. S!AR15-10 TaxID=2950437 RepID=UPI00285BC7BC|nr:phage tail protein [Aliifodinibius sp. S!AR15-10]MDR8390618.1 phage tail protein [Aliifodinibius sp. S!AR15-10]